MLDSHPYFAVSVKRRRRCLNCVTRSCSVHSASTKHWKRSCARLRVCMLRHPHSSHSPDVVKNAGLEFNAELRILPGWRSVVSRPGRAQESNA